MKEMCCLGQKLQIMNKLDPTKKRINLQYKIFAPPSPYSSRGSRPALETSTSSCF